MLRFVLGTFAIGGTGYFGFATLHYFYSLMTQVALLFVPIVGVFVAAEIFVILWLQKHRNPTVAAAGQAFGAAMAYLALFQGVFFTTIVLWAVSIAFGFGGDAPQTRTEFLADFLIGAGYLSAFIMGATGFTAMTTGGGWHKLVGLLYAAVTIAVPVSLLIVAEPQMKAFAAAQPGQFALAVVAYLMAASAVGMAILMPDGMGPRKKSATAGAKPKGRLPG